MFSKLLILTMGQEQKTWNKLPTPSSSYCTLRGCGFALHTRNAVMVCINFAFSCKTAEISNVSSHKNLSP